MFGKGGGGGRIVPIGTSHSKTRAEITLHNEWSTGYVRWNRTFLDSLFHLNNAITRSFLFSSLLFSFEKRVK